MKEIISTAVISIILAVALVLIVVKMIKNKRAGKSSCGCGCSGCAMKDICHSKSKNNSENETTPSTEN